MTEMIHSKLCVIRSGLGGLPIAAADVRMEAVTDPLAVVSPACQAAGTENLSYANSFMFPRTTNVNLNT